MSKTHYDVSGIPMRHRDFRPKIDNKNEKWQSVYEHMKSRIQSGALLTALGGRGAGKTQLGVSLIGYVALELDLTCLYRKAFDVFLRIREGMKAPGDSEKKALDEFLSPFFLVIDAYEVRSDSDFENRVLDHIIDKRYDNLKSTLIISNDTAAKFSAQIGPSICDRIRETGVMAEMNWESFRAK